MILPIKTVKWSNSINLGLKRPAPTQDAQFSQKVKSIIQRVRSERDTALFAFTKEYDGIQLDTLRVQSSEIQDAYSKIKRPTLDAIRESIRRVRQFHQAQFPRNIDLHTSPGVRCQRRFLPISRVGLYIPGGTAPLPSTVIMLGVPSQIAGCANRVLVTPPALGGVAPAILVAADLLGIQEIYTVGGAQAIAALAYGTESITKVSKIYGPGNSWVTEAKLQVSQDPEGAGCDLPAGPSEVMVIADRYANSTFVAADLLSQAEHGPDSQVILISDSQELIQSVQLELEKQLEFLPRKAIAFEALKNSLLIQVERIGDAIPICNEYAPEHLILQIGPSGELGRCYLESIENAGSIFLGQWTPESVGDYASGTNHVLPTYGYARAFSGLGTESFMKSTTVQELTPAGLQSLGPTVEALAQEEGLDAHKNAVSIRLRALDTSVATSRTGQNLTPPLFLARADILEMKAYESARSLLSKGSLDGEPVFLDANESFESVGSEGLNRYPEPQPQALLERFAELYSVTSAQLQVGRGSDEAIDTVIRSFCEAGKDQILTCPPTYGMYEVSAKIQGVETVQVPLLRLPGDDFKLNVQGICKALNDSRSVKVIFLCSPNNPTGTAFRQEDLVQVLEATQNRCWVVVDEAYMEYASGIPSMLGALGRFPNLIVLRTLSKAWGLAGLRCGVAVAHAETIQLLQKVRAPYPISTPVLKATLEALSDENQAGVLERITQTRVNREKLRSCLLRLSGVEEVYSSQTNFLLVKFKDSHLVFNTLKSRGIILRDRSQEPGLEGCIRITIGSESQTQTLIAALEEVAQ